MATAWSRRSVPRSLHTLEAGERARIKGILFERLRQDCRTLGLEAGQDIVCRVSGPDWLILDVIGAGRRQPVLLQRDWARFVEVE